MNASLSQWILTIFLIAAALGVILTKKPVYAGISFLMALLILSALYMGMAAQFVGIMQVLIYAGAILVIFMFVIILFQDAHREIERTAPRANRFLSWGALLGFCAAAFYLSWVWIELPAAKEGSLDTLSSLRALGKTLYIDFFFPFEAIILLLLTALIGTVYIAKRENR